MINTTHLIKVMMAWTSVVYTVCYVGVAVFPSTRQWFMRFALHADSPFVSSYFSFGYFISGLVIWNAGAVLGAWLFAYFFNTIKK